MNREALIHLFEEEMEVEYLEQGNGYVLEVRNITSDELSEIAACNAAIQPYTPKRVKIFPDPGQSAYSKPF